MAHPNARLTPHGRRLLADRIRAGWTITAAARAVGISRQTGSTWWHRAELGWLADRTSAVYHQARQPQAPLWPNPHPHPADLTARSLPARAAILMRLNPLAHRAPCRRPRGRYHGGGWGARWPGSDCPFE